MHWADAFVKDLTGKQTVSTGISPSGHIHVGNMREILTGYFIHRATLDRGLESRFIYLCDDIDPLRKVYPFLSQDYAKYVGMPLSSIPAPESNTSYSEYFLGPFLTTLDKLNVQVEVLRSTDLYRQGVFAKATDLVMENTQRIKQILETVSGRKLEESWAPYNPICSSCGRLTTTSVTGYSFPFIEYKCICGHAGKSDIRKNEGKLPWRIEWPAKWYALGVTIEPFGKDHGAAGGSYDTGKAIAEEVFGVKAPKPLTYEHLNLKGKGPMHSSTGNVIPASEMVESAPPEILRFLFARSQPWRHLDFDPGLGLLNLVDEYEKYRNVYYGLEESQEEDASRIYELSRIREEKPGDFVSFRHLITLVQIYPGEDQLLSALQRGGYKYDTIGKELHDEIGIAKSWLVKFAPEQVKFALLPEDAPVELTEKERSIVTHFLDALPSMEWTPESIHNSVHELIKAAGFEPKVGFSLFYRVLIGKERGPRLGYFLSNLSKNSTEARFRRVLGA